MLTAVTTAEEGDGPPPHLWLDQRGAGWLSSVLIVGVVAGEVEGMLAARVGPRPPAGARCPDCDGELRGCWAGYERWVRFSKRVERLRIGARSAAAAARRTPCCRASSCRDGWMRRR